MRKWMAAAAVGVVLAATAMTFAPRKADSTSAPAAATVDATAPQVQVATAQVKILDMDCAGCAGGIINRFKHADGIQDIQIDADKKLGTVQYDAARLKPADLLALVEKAGFKGELVQ